jgi:hypothetical protein
LRRLPDALRFLFGPSTSNAGCMGPPGPGRVTVSAVERPRDVFLAACDSIAATFEPLGFSYARSGHRLRRRRGEFLESFHFQSSHYNSPGYVAMWPHAIVQLRALGAWREASSPLRGDYVAVGQLGNLAGVGWRTWDLGEPTTRAAVIDDVVGFNRSVALPWFDLVEDVDTLIAWALADDVPGTDIEGLVDYLVFLGRPETASAVTAAWRDRRGNRDSTGFLARLRPVVEHHWLGVELPPTRETGRLPG